jgi:hypothetical protein
LDYNWRKCTDYSVTNHTVDRKQVAIIQSNSQTYSVQLWSTVSNREILRFQKKYPKELSSMLLGTSSVIYYHLNVPYVRDDIKRFNEKYADRLEKHSVY